MDFGAEEGRGYAMDAFLVLAGQQLLIICVQSVLETLAVRRQHTSLQKSIELGCYLASLALVLRFMQRYIFDMLRMMGRF